MIHSRRLFKYLLILLPLFPSCRRNGGGEEARHHPDPSETEETDDGAGEEYGFDPATDAPEGFVLPYDPDEEDDVLHFFAVPPPEPVGLFGNAWDIHTAGYIDPGSALRLEENLREFGIPDRSYLHFHITEGGWAAAMDLGRAIRRAGLYTSIESLTEEAPHRAPGICADACLLAYLGGTFRTLHDGSAVVLTTPPPPQLEGSIRAYLLEMGVDTGLLAHWRQQTGRYDVVALSDLELDALGICSDPQGRVEWSIQMLDGQPYLRGYRETSRGMQKLLLYCHRGDFIAYAIFHPEGRTEEILREMDAVSFILDGEVVQVPERDLLNRHEVNGMINVIIRMDRSLVPLILRTERLGVICQHYHGAPVFMGFDDMSLEGGADLLPGLLHACR